MVTNTEYLSIALQGITVWKPIVHDPNMATIMVQNSEHFIRSITGNYVVNTNRAWRWDRDQYKIIYSTHFGKLQCEYQSCMTLRWWPLQNTKHFIRPTAGNYSIDSHIKTITKRYWPWRRWQNGEGRLDHRVGWNDHARRVTFLHFIIVILCRSWALGDDRAGLSRGVEGGKIRMAVRNEVEWGLG